MMYFSLITSDDKRLVKLVIQQQMKYNMPNTFVHQGETNS